MRISKHGRYLTRLERLRVSNCYLVEDADGLVLIDSSFRGSAGSIVAAARALGAPITRVVLTHAHHDHAGSLEALRRLLPDAELGVGEREAPLLAGDRSAPDGEPAGRLRGYLYEKAAVRPDRLLRGGDRVGPLEVLDAPGHTPGHLAFADSRDGTLIAGDAFLTVGELFVTTEFRWRFPFPALSGTWHAPSALASAQALAELRPARLATGHGPVLESPAPAMAAAVARARRRRQWG